MPAVMSFNLRVWCNNSQTTVNILNCKSTAHHMVYNRGIHL